MMDEQIEDYLHNLKIERGLAPNTIAAYRQDLEAFKQFLGQQRVTTFAEVDQLTILNYLKSLQTAGKARNSVTRTVSTLRRFFSVIWFNKRNSQLIRWLKFGHQNTPARCPQF